MMSAQSIVAEATGLGIRLFAKDGGKLGFDAPSGGLTPGFKTALAENKVAILALLGAKNPAVLRGPCPLALRTIIASWPIDRRERWGRLANDLADLGLVWPGDEVEAYRRLTAGEGSQSSAPGQAISPSEPEPDQWSRLAAERWGWGLEVDGPGILIDRPNLDRRRAAMEAASAIDEDEWSTMRRMP